MDIVKFRIWAYLQSDMGSKSYLQSFDMKSGTMTTLLVRLDLIHCNGLHFVDNEIHIIGFRTMNSYSSEHYIHDKMSGTLLWGPMTIDPQTRNITHSTVYSQNRNSLIVYGYRQGLTVSEYSMATKTWTTTHKLRAGSPSNIYHILDGHHIVTFDESGNAELHRLDFTETEYSDIAINTDSCHFPQDKGVVVDGRKCNQVLVSGLFHQTIKKMQCPMDLVLMVAAYIPSQYLHVLMPSGHWKWSIVDLAVEWLMAERDHESDDSNNDDF